MQRRILNLFITFCMILPFVPMVVQAKELPATMSLQETNYPNVVATLLSPTLVWPVPGHTRMSQLYHDGNAIDIADSSINGATIVAAYSGTVRRIYTCPNQHYKNSHLGVCDGFGTGVVINGEDGRTYQYAHMQANSIPSDVYAGAHIIAGQKIGQVGKTGNASGVHLHFGISNSSNIWGVGPDPSKENYIYNDEPIPVAITTNFTKDTTDKSRYSVNGTNAVLASTLTVSGTSISGVSNIGIALYDKFGTQVGWKEEKPVPKGNQINMWYDVNEELGYTLVPSEYYEYKFFADINGTRYHSDVFVLDGGGHPSVKPMSYLDINWLLDGREERDTQDYCTVDVYVNGNLVADDCTDYCALWPVGSVYQIGNITPRENCVYSGIIRGALNGTIGSDTVEVWLSFSTLYFLDLNWLLDGNEAWTEQDYATADIYINDALVADDCSDYCVKWPVGTAYRIEDIKPKAGYQYNGVYNGFMQNPISGTIQANKINQWGRFEVWLSFSVVNTAINSVIHNGNTLTANVVCADSNATVFCAVYNNSGKMIAVRSAQVTSESNYQFQFDGQKFNYAKAFVVDANFRPLCESKHS